MNRSSESSMGNFKSYMQRHWGLYAMLILPIGFFVIFSYLPMINLLIAFMTNNIFIPITTAPWERWVGLANFRWALDNIQFRQAVSNTLMFSFLDLVIGFPMPIILALLLNELKFKVFKRVTQTISYMPFFLSWILVGGLMLRLFQTQTGAVNNIFMNIGFGPVPFLTSSNHWIFTNVFTAIWRGLGWNTIIYLAAITAVNPELYEAAEMDGATRLKKMWHVTLPGIRPVIVTLLILTLGGIMGADMARFLATENHLVRDASTVLPIFVFRWGLEGAQYHRAAAVGLIASVINLIILFSANFTSRKITGNGLW
ncbi:MAG: ABC transporter permease subunit [Defluviitaleaceae bacterium]|nr:ABC transporter permease subunit [Defluviitaleaceae bacterium]